MPEKLPTPSSPVVTGGPLVVEVLGLTSSPPPPLELTFLRLALFQP